MKKEYIDWEEKYYDELKLFKFYGSDMQMWPYIRMDLFFEIEAYNGGLNTEKPYKITYKKIKYYVLSLLQKKIPKKQYDILFITNTLRCVEKIDSKYYNWLCDEYAKLYPDNTIILEQCMGYEYKKPRYFKNTFCLSAFDLQMNILRKTKNDKKENIDNIERLINFIAEVFPGGIPDTILKKASYTLKIIARSLNQETIFWAKVLDKIKPKIMIVDGGANARNHIFEEAKKRGIITCEMQHGMIGNGHAGYVYCDKALKDIKYRAGMPQYLLTFGNFWNQTVKTFSECITLGSPKHFREGIDMNTFVRNNLDRKQVLFISNSLVFTKWCEIIDSFRNIALQYDFEIVLRPHPSDSHILSQYQKFCQEQNIILDTNRKISEALQQSAIIVSEDSSVVFEALIYECKVILFEREGAITGQLNDKNLQRVVSYEELEKSFINFITSTDDEHIDFAWKKYFDTAWKRNYCTFINEKVYK